MQKAIREVCFNVSGLPNNVEKIIFEQSGLNFVKKSYLCIRVSFELQNLLQDIIVYYLEMKHIFRQNIYLNPCRILLLFIITYQTAFSKKGRE